MIPARNYLSMFACLLLWLGLASASARADDFERGMQALETGDIALTLELWRPLAERGHVEAQFGLGVIYNDAMGVAQDYAEANYWFLRAAEQGFPAAQYNLGNAYKNGTGMAVDPKMAVIWWRKAAEQGFAPAQFNLGSALIEGLGTPRDVDAGLAWYRKAAAGGHPQAQALLEELAAEDGAQSQRQTTAQETVDATAADAPAAPAQSAPGTDASGTDVQGADAPASAPASAARESAASAMRSADTGTAQETEPAVCADWLDRDANAYTVQLLSSQKADDAFQYAARHALSGTAVCSYVIKGRRWHALLYGRYGSAVAARAALALLPAQVRADGAYVRRIAEIRAAMRE